RITGRQRLRSALVVAEAALALTLIIAAAALLRSFRTLETVRPGFEPHGVTTATISFPRTQYPTAAKQSLFYRQLLQRLPPASGVVLGAPFTGFQSSSGLEIQGRPFPRDASAIPHGDYRLVTPGFFEALRIPLLRGRLFDVGDRKESEPVAVVDQTIADRFWPGEDPIGKRLRPADGGPWYTIIGISGHVLQSSLANDSGRGMVYYDLYQTAGPIPFATIVTRAPVDAVRAAVAGADPAESIFDIQNLEARVAASLAARGFVLRIMSFFAAVALFLAALGLYGVISFAVNRRTREIGVRVALGARSATVSYMVVGEGLRLVAFGAVLGLALSAALARTLEAQLYHVRPLDFGAVFLAVALLFAVAAAASLFPARRAASVDPVAALRCE
ncbi:MAG TPA: FtsX-like permease family protein, partial [Bryobacteraceae bacterium]|nr:FtsX-like permease family protein [Bryobacteraceae bacterium]